VKDGQVVRVVRSAASKGQQKAVKCIV